jgi:hypothetical protein
MLWLLSQSWWVRWIDQLDPGSCESEIFPVVEVFCQASLMRVGTWSRRPVERVSCESERGRGVSFDVSARPVFVGKVFGVVFSGVCFSWSLIVGTPCFGTRHIGSLFFNLLTRNLDFHRRRSGGGLAARLWKSFLAVCENFNCSSVCCTPPLFWRETKPNKFWLWIYI